LLRKQRNVNAAAPSECPPSVGKASANIAGLSNGAREFREIDSLGFGCLKRLLPGVDEPAHSLSYANRRRAEIARALALRPRLLLLDEPTAGMNPTERPKCRRWSPNSGSKD